jgi:hypothetical protein
MKIRTKLEVMEPEKKGSLGGPRSRWEERIEMYLKEREYEGLDWINVA